MLVPVQVVFDYTQQEGVLVGFWCPPFVGASLNEPGFHFHFLSSDKQRGGHVLQVEVQQGAMTYLQEVRWGVWHTCVGSTGRICLDRTTRHRER